MNSFQLRTICLQLLPYVPKITLLVLPISHITGIDQSMLIPAAIWIFLGRSRAQPVFTSMLFQSQSFKIALCYLQTLSLLGPSVYTPPHVLLDNVREVIYVDMSGWETIGALSSIHTLLLACLAFWVKSKESVTIEGKQILHNPLITP